MTAAAMSPFLREGLAVLETTPIRRLAARMVGADQPDVLSEVAIRLVEMDQDPGREPPDNVAAYVLVMVRNQCLRLLVRERAACRTPVPDPAMTDAAPGLFPESAFADDEGREPVAPEIDDLREVTELLEAALARISPDRAEQIRLTYWDEVPVRDAEARGVPFGTAVSRTLRGRHELADMPEVIRAAELLGIRRGRAA